MAKDIETESFQEFPIGSRLPSYMEEKRERKTERERARESEINMYSSENCIVTEALILHTCTGK